MTKKKQSISCGATLWLLLLFVFGSCADEQVEESTDVIEGKKTYLSVNVIANAAVGTADVEDQVHKVRVIAYRSGTYTSPLCNELRTIQSGEGEKPIEVESGNVDIYVIVNETSAMHLGNPYITASDIQEQVLKIDDFSHSIATDGLPMYRELVGKHAVVIPENKESDPYLLKVEVDRIMAKLTLRITNSTHTDILLEKVAVVSVPINSWLHPTVYSSELMDTLEISLVPNSDRSSYDSVSLYIPEYIVKDTSKRSYLSITGKSDKGFDCQYIISLGDGLRGYATDGAVKDGIKEGKLTARDFNIVRNTHYEITVRDIKGYENNKLSFIVGVTPWCNIPENYYEGGTWHQQPTSKRIAVDSTALFMAKFTHTQAPYITYKWYRSQYKQTKDDPLPSKLTVELLKSENLRNGETSTLAFDGKSDSIKPNISGEIFCMAAPISASNFRESSHATLMVIGDWEGGDVTYPDMQNWKPAEGLPPGTSYLLLDNREETYGGKKVYRVKLMADGNWWMVQDLAYSGNEPTPILDFLIKSLVSMSRPGLGGIGSTYFGACTISKKSTGGYLYTKEAAIGDRIGLPTSIAGSLTTENVIGICPEGWHLPGNKNEAYNREWTDFTNSLSQPVTVSTISLFDYCNPKHFNAYTDTYVVVNEPDLFAMRVEENSYRFHGGFFAAPALGMISIGVKVGIDTELIPEQKGDLFINIAPEATETIVLPFPHSTAVIRCMRNNIE